MENIVDNKLGDASNFFTSDPSECVKIIKCKNDFTSGISTVPEMFAKTVDLYSDRTALMHQNEETGDWIPISYKSYKNRVDKVAKAFLKLGLEKNGKVAVIAFNSVEWFLSQLGVIHAGGQIVGIYGSNSAEACLYILEKCHANIIVVDEDYQLEKILKIRDQLPHLKAIIKTLPSPNTYEGVMSWKELEEMDTDDYDQAYDKNLKEIKANSCCCLIFTSGTTGNPKGAMISHDNVIFNVKNFIEAYNFRHTDPEVSVSYLPLSHVAGSMIEIFVNIGIAGTVYFADKNALKGSLINTLLAARPTFFFGVPRVYEKFHEKISHGIKGTSGLAKMIATWATNTAINYHLSKFSGKPASIMSYSAAKTLVLNKIKAQLGLDRCKTLMVGAAPINVDTLKFFLSIDLPIYELYGMTEVGLTFLSTSDSIRLGSVGKRVQSIEAKILNPDEDGIGEICTRGRNSFMGYVFDIEKTRQIIDDELWVHSGDVGYIDKNGFLFLTGRIKELIITAGGENIPFLNIENAVLAECSAISNAFLIGDKRKFLTMLIALKTESDSNGVPQDELAEDSLHHMTNLGLNYKLLSEVLNAGPDEKVLNLIQEAIDRANAKAASNAQKVQKFMVLPNEFSMHTGELGPTMKLKRGFVMQKYKNEIEKFYA
ncbi:unnamed protein product [Chironomus riparius]|uniref:long-chain-fatty-acid--CoA ligase n=1 Tax=Chironomus riparius TaxID=315576 RepID=A0A9P0ISS9_9DIPT|nr:unnamed protein product [Chironomus riparius]